MLTCLAILARPSDDGWGGVLFLGAIAAIAVSAAWWSGQRMRTRAAALQPLARRWNGSVRPGGFLSLPWLAIRDEGAAGEVTFHAGSKHRSAWSKVHFDWRSSHRLRLTPQGFMSWVRSLFGASDVEVGDPVFDAAFWIESSDHGWAKQVFTGSVRRRLLRQRDRESWFASNIVTLDFGPGGMVLKIDRCLVDRMNELDDFVNLAILILKEARGTGTVRGVVLATVETRAGSACPVCGHAVEKGRLCPSCRTPQHEDCWTYSGGCAIFGCSSRRSAA